MNRVEIRAASVDDHAAVDALAREAWQVLKPGYDPQRWDALLTSVGGMSKLASEGRLLVATASERVAGAVGYMPPGRSSRQIFVHPRHRGRGIGKALMNACIREALADGAHCIGLHTSPIMEVALAMYLRMGFIKDAELPPIAGAPYARYVLSLDASRVRPEGADDETNGALAES